MKLAKFSKFMDNSKIDLSLMLNSTDKINPNFVYFTQTGNVNAVLLLNKNPILFVSSLETSIAKENSKIRIIKILDKNFFDSIKKFKPRVIGIDKNYITLSQFRNLKKNIKKVKFKDISQEIAKLRAIKTEDEISLIKKSCNYADLVMQEAISFAKKAKTELNLKKYIEKKILDLGLETSFVTIVASSKNSRNPHHLSNSTKLKGFTVIDLGVRYKNYCSDISRTIYIGKPNEKEIMDYNKVLKVQEECINKNLSPLKLNDYSKQKLSNYLTHSLGHGIGLEVHENPRISSMSKDKFEDNMVFTIEPGYYNRYGIRIEDVFLYKNNKKISLTKSPKTFLKL